MIASSLLLLALALLGSWQLQGCGSRGPKHAPAGPSPELLKADGKLTKRSERTPTAGLAEGELASRNE